MKIKYTNVKKSKITNEQCPICGKFQTKEDVRLGCEKCNWQKDGIDVVTPHWINHHESKGHFKTAPSQYSVTKFPKYITKNGKKIRIA